MTDPEQFLGIHYATLIAGFCGTLVSLSFCEPMRVLKVIAFLSAGVMTSAYLPSLMIDYGIFTAKAEISLGFLTGLMTNQVMPGLFKFAKRKAEDPSDILSKAKRK